MCRLLALFAALPGCGEGGRDGDGAGGAAPKPPALTLSIAWGAWEPADLLQRLTPDFTSETGIGVTLHQIPWPQYQQKVFTEFTGRGAAYDIVIGDSQWLGKGAIEGHYVELTQWMKTRLQLDAIAPSSLAALCEYPKGSKRYWAVPCESDATGYAYRRDLFEDPAEQAAFKAKYGYDLAVPRTYEALRDAAEFFTRPDRRTGPGGAGKPAPLYGLMLWLSREYDGVTMGFQQVMWSWGGEYGDPATFQVRGRVNGPDAVRALEFYRGLVAFTPPGSTDGYWEQSIRLFQEGTVAMAMNYFAFFPALADPSRNPHARVTGFFACPAKQGREDRRAVSLGGQGMSLVSYVSDAQKEAAKRFLEWFSRNDTQVKWARLGGFPCDTRVLGSDGFLNATPYNRAFVESLPYLRDFWTEPEYAKLLEVTQTHWHAAVTGAVGAQEALDRVAEEHERIFREAGRLKGP